MDSCGKRLGIALTAVVVVLALNVLAVVSGAASGTYERLLGSPLHHQVAVHDNPRPIQHVIKASECAPSDPKPRTAGRAPLLVELPPASGSVAYMC